ncbi:MAG: PadR family transcriptional regulator [Rhodoglobus sp.]
MAGQRHSPLTLVVLGLLAERPMHPYLMSQLITQRGKDSIANVSQRNSLYQVIERLVRSGLVEVETTERADNRPERTVYRITDAGLTTTKEWILGLLGADQREYPAFPAALSLIALVGPAAAHAALTDRRTALQQRQDAATAAHDAAIAMGLPHLFLLDDEYALALLDAELRWLDGILAEFASGELDWSAEWIAEVAAKFEPEK